MQNRIRTHYDPDADIVVVRFPDPVTEQQMLNWIAEFLDILIGHNLKGSNLLLDSNQHNFESIRCLKLLEETLTSDPVVLSAIKRVAFVVPARVRKPTVVSDTEAYFPNFKDAKAALRLAQFPKVG